MLSIGTIRITTGGRPVSVVRNGNYKLMQFLEDGRLELYDLSTDIGEKQDLASEMHEKANELLAKLNAWKKEVDAPKFLKRTPENEKYARSGSGWIGSNNLKNPPVFRMLDNNSLEIYTFNEGEIFYTLDGSEPNRNSNKYTVPLVLNQGGVVKAKSFSEGGIESDVETEVLALPNVKVASVSSTASGYSAENILDEQTGTYWESEIGLPQEIMFDLGEEKSVKGFIYQPARRKRYGVIEINSLQNNVDGAIKGYELMVSKDKTNWEKATEGDFTYTRYAFLNDNTVWFKTLLHFRYAKLIAKSSIEGGQKVNIEDFRFIPGN